MQGRPDAGITLKLSDASDHVGGLYFDVQSSNFPEICHTLL